LGQELIWLQPQESDTQRWAILRALAKLEPGDQSLRFLLERMEHGLGGPSSLILITPDASGEWLEALLPLTWRGTVPTVLLLDPAAFDPENGTPARALTAELARQGLTHEMITPELLNRPEAQPGRQGQWQWRVTPTGRAVALNPARETTWRSFTPGRRG
jgi:hypothetical protein